MTSHGYETLDAGGWIDTAVETVRVNLEPYGIKPRATVERNPNVVEHPFSLDAQRRPVFTWVVENRYARERRRWNEVFSVQFRCDQAPSTGWSELPALADRGSFGGFRHHFVADIRSDRDLARWLDIAREILQGDARWIQYCRQVLGAGRSAQPNPRLSSHERRVGVLDGPGSPVPGRGLPAEVEVPRVRVANSDAGVARAVARAVETAVRHAEAQTSRRPAPICSTDPTRYLPSVLAADVRSKDPRAILGVYTFITAQQYGSDSANASRLEKAHDAVGQPLERVLRLSNAANLIDPVCLESPSRPLACRGVRSGPDQAHIDQCQEAHGLNGACCASWYWKTIGGRTLAKAIVPLRLAAKLMLLRSARLREETSLEGFFIQEVERRLESSAARNAEELFELFRVPQADGVVGWFLSMLLHPVIDPDWTIDSWARKVDPHSLFFCKRNEIYNDRALISLGLEQADWPRIEAVCRSARRAPSDFVAQLDAAVRIEWERWLGPDGYGVDLISPRVVNFGMFRFGQATS